MCIYDAHGMGFRMELALRAADIFDVTKQAPSDYICYNTFVVNKFWLIFFFYRTVKKSDNCLNINVLISISL